MRRLIYHSTATFAEDANPNTVIRDILRAAQRNNTPIGVTGMLMYEDGVFIQLLEGPREAVTQIFLQLANDPRHTKLAIDECAAITERSFDGFSLGYISQQHGDLRARLLGYLQRAAQPKNLTVEHQSQTDILNAIGRARLRAERRARRAERILRG